MLEVQRRVAGIRVHSDGVQARQLSDCAGRWNVAAFRMEGWRQRVAEEESHPVLSSTGLGTDGLVVARSSVCGWRFLCMQWLFAPVASR